MEIYNSPLIHNAHSVSAPHFRGTFTPLPTETNRVSAPIRDEITLSRESQSLSDIASVSDSSSAAPRLDLINRLRSEIAAGTYDTPEKFETALSRMLGAR
ncbi:MAG: flagellar biosynthesis anti-sigma factor FlgM [Planctomycetaceae bacterium]|nr:flagellar biosynthesis anti-sigma factor FlgM [Planctomycetaceae bacterium]